MNNGCASCGRPSLAPVLDLGRQPLANNLLRQEDLEKTEPKFPLRLSVCQECWLLQITDLVPPVDLFSDYLYFSSFSDKMLAHAAEAASSYIEESGLGVDSLVVEVASNDGYLLKNFVQADVPVLGIEPAANIARVAIDAGIPTLTEFFGLELAERLAEEGKQPDLILGNNVFAHAPDTNDFVAGLKRLLKPEGRLILEFPYGVDFIEKSEFDTIYHEHVFYFTLTALKPLFERHQLEIQRVQKLDIHGGSLRLFAGHPGAHEVEELVSMLLGQESDRGVSDLSFYQAFAERVDRIRDNLNALLNQLKCEGRSIVAYGASAKGSTLLNYVAPAEGTIDFIVDRSTYKQGRYSPGLHLPIVSAERLSEKQPDYALLLTWNFADEILAQQEAYRKAGGQFIVPIPDVRVL